MRAVIKAYNLISTFDSIDQSKKNKRIFNMFDDDILTAKKIALQQNKFSLIESIVDIREINSEYKMTLSLITKQRTTKKIKI